MAKTPHNPVPLDDELLSAYVDGELTLLEREAVEERLSNDPAAKRLVEELSTLSSVIRELPRERLREDLSAGVLSRAAAQSGGQDENSDSANSTTHQESAGQESVGLAGLPFGRSARGWFWAGLAIAAALLVMLFQPNPANDGQGRIARNEPLLEPAPNASEETELEARRTPDLIASDEQAEYTPAEPTENSRLSYDAAETDASPRNDAGIGRSGGAAPPARPGRGAEQPSSDSLSLEALAEGALSEEAPVNVEAISDSEITTFERAPQAIVYVKLNASTESRTYINRTLSRNGFVVTPADSIAGEVAERSDVAIRARAGGRAFTSAAEDQPTRGEQAETEEQKDVQRFYSRELAESLNRTGEPVDLAWVEGSVNQINDYLQELNNDTSNVLSLKVEPQQALAADARAPAQRSEQLVSDWGMAYNRGASPDDVSSGGTAASTTAKQPTVLSAKPDDRDIASLSGQAAQSRGGGTDGARSQIASEPSAARESNLGQLQGGLAGAAYSNAIVRNNVDRRQAPAEIESLQAENFRQRQSRSLELQADQLAKLSQREEFSENPVAGDQSAALAEQSTQLGEQLQVVLVIEAEMPPAPAAAAPLEAAPLEAGPAPE